MTKVAHFGDRDDGRPAASAPFATDLPAPDIELPAMAVACRDTAAGQMDREGACPCTDATVGRLPCACCRSSIPREYARQDQHQVPLAARRLQPQGADAFEGTAQPRCPGRVLRTDGPRIGRAGHAKEGWAGGEAKALCLSEKFCAGRPSDGISGVTSNLSSALCSTGHIPVKPSQASAPGCTGNSGLTADSKRSGRYGGRDRQLSAWHATGSAPDPGQLAAAASWGFA